MMTIFFVYQLFFSAQNDENKQNPPIKKLFHIQQTEKNYGKEINKLAKQFDLPASYLKALIVLECSGRKEIPSRLEKHVLIKLKQVRNRKIKNYGTITYKELKGKSDKELEALSSSWGPFQLMGYLSIEMNIDVEEIYGKKALYWGVFWINKRYGNYLRSKKFKDGFHIHNTGQPYPLIGKPTTHNPDYVSQGLSYIDYYESHKNKKK